MTTEMTSKHKIDHEKLLESTNRDTKTYAFSKLVPSSHDGMICMTFVRCCRNKKSILAVDNSIARDYTVLGILSHLTWIKKNFNDIICVLTGRHNPFVGVVHFVITKRRD